MTATPGSVPDLSIVVPCLNERGNVAALMQRIHELRDSSDLSFEVIFVDGRSSDGTPAEIAAQAAALELDCVRVAISGGPKGYGADIRQGLGLARADVLAWTHADLQCDLGDVLRAFALFRKAGGGKVLVKGERVGRPAFDRFFSRGMEVLNRLVTGRDVREINAQPKLFPRAFFEAHLRSGTPDDFSFDLHALNAAAASGYAFVSLPVDMKNRMHGEAKGGGSSLRSKLKLSRRTAGYILRQSWAR